MSRSRRLRTVCLKRDAILCMAACTAVVMALPRPAEPHGQVDGKVAPEPNVIISEADRRTFASAFGGLASEGKITIISEGAPLHPELTTAEIADLDANLPRTAVPLSVAVAQLAMAFDYEAERTFPNVVVLRKRYSDPADLPCVTYDEMTHSLEQMLKLTESFSPPSPSEAPKTGLPATPQTEFAASLSPEQLRSAGRGMRVSELGPELQALALRAGEYLLLMNQETSIRKTLEHLRELRHADSKFGWMIVDNKRAFGYLMPHRLDGAVRKYPLTDGFRAEADGSYYFRAEPAGKATDPSAPTAEDIRLAPGMFAQGLPCVKPLARVAAMETPVGTGKKISVRVNAAVAEKPVGIFGENNSTQDRRVRSLAALYGLRLLVGDRSDYLLTLPSVGTQQEFSDYPAEIARLFPLPLSRLLDERVKQYTQILPRRTQARALDKRQAELQGKLDRLRVLPEAAATLYYPAVRRIVALALPAAPRPASPPVAINRLNSDVLRLVSLAMLSGACLRDIDTLSRMEVPGFVTNPQNMFVLMGYKPDLFAVTAFGSGERSKRDNSPIFDIMVSTFAPGYVPGRKH